ncbi:hypothetical protein QL285_031432 [Trifolium repens]|nr:hypothetical protein QL285_031432 [Trifolium repens]
MLCSPHHLSVRQPLLRRRSLGLFVGSVLSVRGGWFVGSLRFCLFFAVICSFLFCCGGWFAGVRPFSRWVHGVLFFPAVVVRCASTQHHRHRPSSPAVWLWVLGALSLTDSSYVRLVACRCR